MLIVSTRIKQFSPNLNSIHLAQLEQVDTFPYLGSLITADAECGKEIKARLSKGQVVRMSLKQLYKNHGIPIETKLRLERALVCPVATYGCESWTIKKSEERRIEAFEMKGLRQIMRVSWIAKKSNDWVLDETGTKRQLLASIKQRKLSYYGHVTRKQGDSLGKEIIQGTLPGSRTRGRPCMKWLDNIIAWTGVTAGQLVRKVEDRDNWRRITQSATNPRIEDGWRRRRRRFNNVFATQHVFVHNKLNKLYFCLVDLSTDHH